MPTYEDLVALQTIINLERGTIPNFRYLQSLARHVKQAQADAAAIGGGSEPGFAASLDQRWWVQDIGAADAIEIIPTQEPETGDALVEGLFYWLEVAAANTGAAVTMEVRNTADDVNLIADVKQYDGSDLEAGDLQAGDIGIFFAYNNAGTIEWRVLNIGQPSRPSQAQAEDDTNTTIYSWAPERVHQAAKAALTAPSKSQATNPANTTVYGWTPQRVHQAAQAAQAGTDGGTDAFEFNAGYDLAVGDVITVDFGSANDTATPTAENTGGAPAGAQSIVTPSGAAYIGMIQARPHRLQWDGTDFVLLDPNTLQAAPAVDFSVSLAFDTWRTPNANRPTFLAIWMEAQTNGSGNGVLRVLVDESGGTTSDYIAGAAFAGATLPANTIIETNVTVYIPPGGSYEIFNLADPASGNAINRIVEVPL